VIEDLSEGEFPDPSVLMSLWADWIEHDADAEGLSETKYLENKSIIQRELRALNEQHGNVVLTGHSQGGTNALRAAADMPTFVKEVVTFQGAGTTADAAEQLDQHNVDVTAYTHSQDLVHTLGYHPENTNPIRLNRDDGGVGGAHTSMLLGETGDASRFGEGGGLEQEFNESDVEQLDEHESKNSPLGDFERTARNLMLLSENIPTPENMMDKLGDGYWEMQKDAFRFYTTGEFENETETETTLQDVEANNRHGAILRNQQNATPEAEITESPDGISGMSPFRDASERLLRRQMQEGDTGDTELDQRLSQRISAAARRLAAERADGSGSVAISVDDIHAATGIDKGVIHRLWR
jgi:hypothetical protein